MKIITIKVFILAVYYCNMNSLFYVNAFYGSIKEKGLTL